MKNRYYVSAYWNTCKRYREISEVETQKNPSGKYDSLIITI